MTPEHKADYRASLQKLINQRPGDRLMSYDILQFILQDMCHPEYSKVEWEVFLHYAVGPMKDQYILMSEEVKEFLWALVRRGELSIKRGRMGGILLQWQLSPEALACPLQSAR